MKLLIFLFLFLSSASYAQTITDESTEPYSRDIFGNWADDNGDCQNTRHEVLIRDAVYFTLDETDCKVISGLWIDFYTGEYIYSPLDIDIDHVVPLKEIWDSGGSLMTSEQLRYIANYMDNLVVTTSSLNRSKGSREPHEWRFNPRILDKCRFINKWFNFKLEFSLTFDQTELDFLYDSGC